MANFPSKLYPLKESVLYYMVEVMKELQRGECDVLHLYRVICAKKGIQLADFMDALVCLFAINEIVLEKDILKLVDHA